MPFRSEDPVPATRLAALRKRTGKIDRAPPAGSGGLDGTIVSVQSTDPHGCALRAEHEPIARRHAAGGDRAGDDETDPGQGKGPVYRHPEQTRCGSRRPAARSDMRAFLQMPGESGNPLAGAARHRENRCFRKARRGEQRARLRCHGVGPAALDPVDLGHHRGDLVDPDQL